MPNPASDSDDARPGMPPAESVTGSHQDGLAANGADGNGAAGQGQAAEGEAPAVAAAGAEGAAQAAEGAQPAAAGEAVEGQAAAPAAAKPEAKPAAEPKDGKQRRIDTLTARLRETEAENERLKQAGKPAEADPAAAADPAAPKQDINKLVDQEVRVREFNKACNEAAASARTRFSDFDDRMQSLKDAIPRTQDGLTRYNSLLLAITESDDPGQALYDATEDIEATERLMTLSPVKIGIEIGKKTKAQVASATVRREPSNAPKPIQPVGARGVQHQQIQPDDPETSDKLSTEEFMRRRNIQATERHIR